MRIAFYCAGNIYYPMILVLRRIDMSFKMAQLLYDNQLPPEDEEFEEEEDDDFNIPDVEDDEQGMFEMECAWESRI
jgi:hypothetical protein